MFNKFIKNEKGAVLPIVAVFLAFVAFGMAAIVIDVGFLYSERRELVTAADAAALAGAKEMQKYGSTEGQVKTAAINVAIANGAVNTENDDVEVYFTGSTSDAGVRVTVENTVNLFFAGFFTEGSSVVKATALASPMRLSPGIFPIGVNYNNAYGADKKPKKGLYYLHDSKEKSFASFLNLDENTGDRKSINSLIINRDKIIGDKFAENLYKNQAIKIGTGWKNINVQNNELVYDEDVIDENNKKTVKVMLDRAYHYYDSPEMRRAYMTALAPVYTGADNQFSYIKEFAEIIILDQIFVQNSDVEHVGLANAFTYDLSSSPISSYTERVATPIKYPKLEDATSGTDVIIVYITGATVSIADLLNGNYSGTYYDQVKLNAISLIE